MKISNRVGVKIGKLIVESFALVKNDTSYWNCLCECGNKTVISLSNTYTTKSCGCSRKNRGESRRKNLTGQKFYYLTAIKITGKYNNSESIWLCQCDCGNYKNCTTSHLTRKSNNRKIKDCGCGIAGPHRNLKDLSGSIFGRWTVLRRDDILIKSKNAYWLCECTCGKIKSVDGCSLRQGDSNSCGCLAKELSSIRKKLLTGDKHPNWNPNLTQEEREIKRKMPEYSEWSAKVKERDGYVCQVSGQTGGELVSHHLDGWSWCKEKRFDIDNGITICKSLHDFFHSIYHTGNNTKEQFEEFIFKYVLSLEHP